MKDIVGIFRRSGPKDRWSRLMASGTAKQAFAFQQMYPNHEISLFKYDGSASRPFDERCYLTLKPVKD